MENLIVYHVVTGRAMHVGQEFILDESHPNGVYCRVMEKLPLVLDIYAHPERYRADELEHHTAVALRELAMETVRRERFPAYPSRLGCLYGSEREEEAIKWAKLFVEWGRPTYHVVKLHVHGARFVGDANNCFQAVTDLQENLVLAERYWRNEPNLQKAAPIRELLVAGTIRVLSIVKEIRQNLD